MQAALRERAEILYQEDRVKIFKSTDRLFAWLMIFQWFLGIAAAAWISPRAWAGESSYIHLHVWAAIFLGGLISLPAVLFAFKSPGETSTRYIISVSQMLTSALLIHLTGGRIETHFHVFGSLAFLAFYRDWKVLVPATFIVAADHWIRGVYWPQSVYGILAASPWRWIEHTGWVLFEDVVLIASCLRSTKEMRAIAERTAELEATNHIIEAKVVERTKELANEIEERKKLEAIVIQSEKMKAIGQLAGGVAHEINNPLGVILGFSQNVVDRIKPGDPLEMPLRSIEREAVRCKNLVQDLLTFSRVSKTVMEEIDLNKTIETALTLVTAQGKVKKVEIEKSLEPNLPKIPGNSTQLQQVIVNLSNNAIDAMPSGGRLKIRTRKAAFNGNGGIGIDVEDTGTGMPQEIQKRIFEPFFTTKGIGKGTGLGLSLVYEIIQKHQGSIQLESHPGRGTIFHITLPAQS